MKPLNRKCSSVLLSAVLAVLFSVNHSAFAATYYWDNNGTTAGFGTAGGTWAAPTASQWSTDGTGVAAPGASITSGTGDAINFGNGATGLAAGTVTVSGSVSSGNATFASGSGAIVLSGGTGIALAAPSVITINNAADTISTPIASGALTKAGTGALSLGGGGSISTLRVSNGTLAITGGTLGASSFSFVGDTASQSGVASVASGATLNFNNGNGGGLGYASAASGAIYNSGTFSATQLYMSDTANNGSYGYIQNAGTMTVNNSLNIARNNNANIVDVVAGGAATIGTSGGLYLATAANATAGLNITGGGTFTDNENGDQAVINSGSGAYTSINISGAGSKLIMVGGSGFNVNNNGGAVSTFTLANGGELDAAYTYTYNTGAAFNFNNGTLKATGANGLFEGGGPYAVYVYSGGAIINNNGFASTVQFPLLAPVADGTSTYGVTGITLGGTDTGYIGAPVVKITGGGGKGAAAIASFNPGTGTITGITVTAPGSGYTSTPTITLVGGNGGSTGSGAGTATATASIGAVSSGGVTFSGSGTTTLSGGASTYTGNTVISSGQLSLTGSASLASGNIIVSNNAMLDVSGISFTLGGSQNLKGNGTNNGSINTTSGSGIYADAGVAYGTNTFNNNLTLVSGATAYFNLGTVYNGSNDLINVTGSLVDNGSVQISAPSTSVNLDTNQDYVLITSTGFSGTLSPTPLWGVKPLNWRNFTVVQNGNNVQLHYTASTPPVATGSASPATVTRNQSTLVSVTVTPGSGTVDPNYGVSLNESSLGLSSVYLVLSGTPNVYTNTITIPATVAAGNYTLNALVTDSTPLTGAANISLAVVATNQIWNGAGANNFTKNNTNWISGFAPGYVGDAMTFAGNVNLSPDLDQNYTVTGVTFNANAGGFTISTAESTTLTLTNGTGVVNNSANVQTLNVPVVLGASQIINAASNNIVLSGAISGAAGLTKTGNGALTLSGNNTYSGVTTVSAGTAILSGNNTIGDVEATNGLLKITAGTSAVASTSGNTYVDRGGSLEVDAGATLNISGSTAWYPIGNTVGTTSTVTVAGGTINVANGYNTAVGRIGYGVLTINSGTFSSTDTHTIGLVIGDQGTAQGGTVNLNGGSLVANKLVSNNGTNYFYFNGGTLLPTSDTSSWWNYSSKMSAQVRNGGAIIDDTGVNVTIAQNLVHSTVVGDSAIDGGLIKTNTGTLTLAGTNTYTGNTVISAGTLALGTNGSIISTNINVTSGATFDVWALASYTLNSGQHLEGSGQVNAAQNGLVAAASGSAIYPGTDGTIGTLTINGGLTLNGGATVNFDLGTSNTADGGANDQITVSGALTLNGNAFHIKAPSSLVGLDTNSDYVLITAGSISGSFNSIPVWDVAPANSNNFSVVTSGGQVTLHYSTLTPPTGSGFATPSTAVHNQNVLISVTVTNGSGTVDPNTGVVLNASTIGGSSSVPLVLSGTPNVYTNTITIPAAASYGSYILTATITDSYSDVGTANIPLIVSSTEVWNGLGGDQNWDTGSNWVSTIAPDLTGDDLVFAGNVGTAPNMDNSYSVDSLTFSSNAGSFTIGSTTSSTLTLTGGGITNNSAYAQTLNVPVADAGGGLTKSGNSTVILAATNTYTGNTTINAGVLNVSGAGQLNAGAYAAAIVDNGTFAYSSSASQVLSGAISGTGGMTVNATNGGVLTLGSGAGSLMTYTGPTIVDGGELQLNFANVGNSYGIAASSGLIINNGASVVLMNDNSLAGGNFVVGSVPVTINAGGVLTGSDTVDGGAGSSAHIFGLLTLNGGTLANGGTGAQPQWGTWNLDGGVVVNGGTNTSTMSALDMIPTQAGGTIFSVTNGGTASGVDLNVTGTLINGTSMHDTGIILDGNGTMVLSGTNTYAGQTIVSNGTLLVNGSITGAVTVEGGTLGGIGTIGGAVMVNSGGSLDPQNLGAGTLAINGNITLNVGSTSTFAVNGSTTANDAVAAGGTVAYGGVLNIVTNGSFSLGQTFTLFSGSGAASASSFSSIAGSPGSGLAFAFTNGVLSVVSAFTPSANNLLTCLAVNPPAGILSGFVSNTMTYSVTNYLPNNPVTVTVTNADPTATNTLFFNTVNEGALASTGATSGALTLTQGAANVLQVQVVSQSGATNTYTVNVTLQPNQTVPHLTNSVSGTTLNLSWPADHLGYRLLVQTNNLNKGVSANIGDWMTVPGSTAITTTSITIIKATNNAYYRLVYP